MSIDFSVGFKGHRTKRYVKQACFARMEHFYDSFQLLTKKKVLKNTPLLFNYVINAEKYTYNMSDKDRVLMDTLHDNTVGRWMQPTSCRINRNKASGKRISISYNTVKVPFPIIVMSGSIYRMGMEAPHFIRQLERIDSIVPEIDWWAKFWIVMNTTFSMSPKADTTIFLGENSGHMPMDSHIVRSVEDIIPFADNTIIKRLKETMPNSMSAEYWKTGKISCYKRDEKVMNGKQGSYGENWIRAAAKKYKLKSYTSAVTSYETERVSLHELIEKVLKPANLA